MSRIRTTVLAAAVAAALAPAAGTAATYPTTPAFDPLPAVVTPDATGSVTVGWTSTFLWGLPSFNPRYDLRIESAPRPPYPATTTTRTIAVPPPTIRNYQGPYTHHQAWRVAARLPGHYTVSVGAVVSVTAMGEQSSGWANKAFDVLPIWTQG